jgi:hypothetical protein
MRERLEGGDPVVPMFGPLGLAWLQRQAEIAEQLIHARGLSPQDAVSLPLGVRPMMANVAAMHAELAAFRNVAETRAGDTGTDRDAARVAVPVSRARPGSWR